MSDPNHIPRRPTIKDKVNMEVCQALSDPLLLECLHDWYANFGAECVITCGRDLVGHSVKSAHGKGWALDLRTLHLFPVFATKDGVLVRHPDRWKRLSDFAEGLGKSLNMGHKEFAKERGYFYVVLEPNELLANGKRRYEHIHLEWTPHGYPPNIKGWSPLKFCYIKAPGKAPSPATT
jgi:hypothetical protein